MLMFLRLYLIKDLIKMSGRTFVSEVYVKAAVVTAFAVIPPLLLMLIMPDGFLRLVAICLVGAVSTVWSVYTFGFTGEEKTMVVSFARNKLRSIFR